MFKFILPLKSKDTEQAERIAKVLEFCKTAKTTSEIMAFLGLTHREHFRAEILVPLIQQELLQLTIPSKPKSPAQKYQTTERGNSNYTSLNAIYLY